MNNNKGFTLVEMLVVVGLLAIFGTAIGISLTRNIKNTEQNKEKEFIQKIVGAANLYASNNEDILTNLYEDKGYLTINTQDLIDAGLIQDNMIDPTTNSKITGTEQVLIELDTSGTINIVFPVTNPEGDYLDAKTIKIEYGSSDDVCFKDLNTNSLRYINSDGSDNSNYLVKNTNIKCNSETVDINKLGVYEVKYDYQLKNNGVWKQATRNVIVEDSVPPTCPSVTPGSTTWINSSRTISVDCNDNYRCENNVYTKSFSNVKTAKIDIYDVSNNKKECNVNVYSDMLAPTNVTISKSPSDEWTNSVTLTGTGIDDLSGIKYYLFDTNNGNNIINNNASVSTITPTNEQISPTTTISNEGINNYYFHVEDLVGNKAVSSGVTVKIDKTKPVITVTGYKYDSTKTNNVGEIIKSEQEFVDNGEYVISNNWVNYGITFKFNSSDSSSGIKSIKWQWNATNSANDTGNTYTGGPTEQNIQHTEEKYSTLTGAGYRKGQWIAEDNAGNIIIITVIVKIDTCENGTTEENSDWSEFGECSKACGTGYQTRTKNKIVKSKYNQFICNSTVIDTDEKECNTQDCCASTEIDTTKCGSWHWSECGPNSQYSRRQRECSLKSSYDGSTCPGTKTDTDWEGGTIVCTPNTTTTKTTTTTTKTTTTTNSSCCTDSGCKAYNPNAVQNGRACYVYEDGTGGYNEGTVICPHGASDVWPIPDYNAANGWPSWARLKCLHYYCFC